MELLGPQHTMKSTKVQPAKSPWFGKTISKSKFIERLIRSRLMSKADVSEFESSLGPQAVASDARAFAQAMVKANRLTRFQAKAIYEGRTKGLTFGEYIILDQIGKGGMGIVYRARHRRMDRLVAIKVLPRFAMATQGSVDRFYREVKTAAKLMHPNIVAALDASEDDGLHYLVMEYVEGQDLGDVLKQSGPLQPELAVNYIIQAATGIQYAHDQGVIHRDIKPANLLLDQSGTIKVLDMGLARVIGVGDEETQLDRRDNATNLNLEDQAVGSNDSLIAAWEQDTAKVNGETRLTRDGQVIGTLDYMPPEQFTDTRNVDKRGDIYSLGCTLYRLLTDQRLFPAETAGAIFQAHRNRPVPKLSSLRPGIPESLDLVFERMLAKEPERRQSTMNQVIRELEQAMIDDVPVVPRIDAAGAADFRSRVRVRRRRVNWVGWSVLTAFVGVMLLGVAWWLVASGLFESGTSSLASSDRDLPVNSSKSQAGEERKSEQVGGLDNEAIPSNLANDSNVLPSQPTNVEQEGTPGAAATDTDGPSPESERVGGKIAHAAAGMGEGLTPGGHEPTRKQNDDLAGTQNRSDVEPESMQQWSGESFNWSAGAFQSGSSNPERSVHFNDNGRKISITQNETGITVSLDGRVVSAKNPAALQEKDQEAYQLYQRAFEVKSKRSNPALELLRQQLEKLQENQSQNPQWRGLFETPQGKR